MEGRQKGEGDKAMVSNFVLLGQKVFAGLCVTCCGGLNCEVLRGMLLLFMALENQGLKYGT